jgi:hypothetical protein
MLICFECDRIYVHRGNIESHGTITDGLAPLLDSLLHSARIPLAP